MENLIRNLPEIINAAAQSYLGIFALLATALSVLAYFFFGRASERIRVVVFLLLFLGVVGFGAAMFIAGKSGANRQYSTAVPPVVTEDKIEDLLRRP